MKGDESSCIDTGCRPDRHLKRETLVNQVFMRVFLFMRGSNGGNLLNIECWKLISNLLVNEIAFIYLCSYEKELQFKSQEQVFYGEICN